MLYQSRYSCFAPIEIPDGSIVRFFEKHNHVHVIADAGLISEYILFEEHEDVEGDYACRVWFDYHGDIHRDEKDGPAQTFYELSTGKITTILYVKRSKKHCLSGPYKVSHGKCTYAIDGVILDKNIWEWCVTNNNGNLPLSPQTSVLGLVTQATARAQECHKNGLVENYSIPGIELDSLEPALNPENWSQITQPNLQKNGTFLVRLNCIPLNDVLRCNVILDPQGNIKSSKLVID